MAIPTGPLNFPGPSFGPMNAGGGPPDLAALAQQQMMMGMGLNPMDSLSLSPFAQFSLPPDQQQKMLDFYRELWMLQQQMQAQMAEGNHAGAQATQRRIEHLYESMGGTLDGISAPPPQPEYPQGGGPPGTGEEVGGGPGTGAVEVNPDDLQGGTPAGRELAASAFQHATDGTGDGRHCYRNVKQDLAKAGINVTGGSAYMAADQLAQNSKVQEVKGLANEDLKKLPPGAIVVWNRGNGHEHGHISIAMGDGREASDVMRKQITNYGTSFRVFLPKDGATAQGGGGGATRRA